MERLQSVIVFFIMLIIAFTSTTSAQSIGVGTKAVVYPFDRLGLEEVFSSLKFTNFLDIEGLTTAIDLGLGFDLNTVIMNVRLFLTRFSLDGVLLMPFTGGGVILKASPIKLVPQGLAGVEFAIPPLFFLGEVQVQTLEGIVILFGVALEL